MMKDQRLELVENIDKYRIGIDDVFAFKRRSCGKCCRNRDDILLNSRDVYNIATALSITHEQVIVKYCDTYIGLDSRIPIVRLMPRGANQVCPLLSGNRCSVHNLKPTALYVDYNIHQEFYPQFEANISKILSVFEALAEIF